MSAGPPQPLADLLALWIHNNNLALSGDATCLSRLQHFALYGRVLPDGGERLVDKASHQLWHLSCFPLSLRPFFFLLAGGLEPKKSTYVKSKTRTTASQQKEQTRLQLANCKTQWMSFIWHIQPQNEWWITTIFPHIYDYDLQRPTPSSLDWKRSDLNFVLFFSVENYHLSKWPRWMAGAFMIGRKNLFMDVLLRR